MKIYSNFDKLNAFCSIDDIVFFLFVCWCCRRTGDGLFHAYIIIKCLRWLENWNIIVDFGAMFLCNTLRYPDNVTAFLFLQLQVCIEHSKVELLNECIHIQFDLNKTNVKWIDKYWIEWNCELFGILDDCLLFIGRKDQIFKC